MKQLTKATYGGYEYNIGDIVMKPLNQQPCAYKILEIFEKEYNFYKNIHLKLEQFPDYLGNSSHTCLLSEILPWNVGLQEKINSFLDFKQSLEKTLNHTQSF